MGNDDKIERTLLTKSNDLLKLIKRILVIFKELAKFIPEKYNLYMILVNYILELCFQSVGIKIHSCNAFFVSKFKNV